MLIKIPNSLRSLLERWSRGVILKRKLPKEFEGRDIFVSPEGGGLRYWKPYFTDIDPMLLNAVRKYIRPDSKVWDIGGNVGFFAFTSATVARNGQVVVFEPDLSLTYLLQKTANANPDLNVVIMPFAVSNRTGISKFNIAERARSTNFLAEASGSSQTGGIRRVINVPTIALDTMLDYFDAPDFIKIDVEGAEHLVLSGMQKVIADHRPIILCEVSSESLNAMIQMFTEFRYKIIDANQLPEEVTDFETTENIIAIPL